MDILYHVVICFSRGAAVATETLALTEQPAELSIIAADIMNADPKTTSPEVPNFQKQGRVPPGCIGNCSTPSQTGDIYYATESTTRGCAKHTMLMTQ
jgi:hypothetical protein